MSERNDISDLVDSYKEEKERKGQSKKLEQINSELVDRSDGIREFRAFNKEEESYVFKRGDHFRFEFLLDKEPIEASLEFFNGEEKKMVIYSRKIEEKDGKYELTFDIGSLLLAESPYSLTLRVDGKKVVEGLKIDVREGEEELGSHIVLEDPMEDCNFPEGKFYVFGDSKDLIEEFEKGKKCATVFTEKAGLDLDRIKEWYDKGKVIENFD